jgi:hypothetical protein
MTTTIRLFGLLIISTTFISCSAFPVDSPLSVTPTLSPTSFTPTPKLSPTTTPIPSVTPSPTQTPVCIESTRATETDGWDCINQSYGFTVHFPSTAGTAGPLGDTVIVWLQNSPSNPRIERMLSIALGKVAESCISSDLATMQIGEHTFIINHGFEPSGVVYEWRSYAITQGSKSACFMFTVGFQTWEQDDPLFPPEKDQGLDEVEAILATFRWLAP